MKADRDEASPYAAMLAAQDVAALCKERGITALHVKLRATGGTRLVMTICEKFNDQFLIFVIDDPFHMHCVDKIYLRFLGLH